MFLRIGFFLCTLVGAGGVFAQDTMTIVERPQGIKNQMARARQAGSNRARADHSGAERRREDITV
jgi:hypothetical protein